MAVEPLTQAQLQAYLARIGFSDAPCCDLETLDGIIGAHVQAIAFENIDVQMGRRLRTDTAAAFAKLVEDGRGGWCYEHNGVLSAALAAIGFDVMRISAGVMRQVRGDAAMGTHLCLLVECNGPRVVDAGFGSWLGASVPLRQGAWEQPPLPVSLATTEDGFWRLSVGLGDNAMSYDFRAQAAEEDQLSALCDWQCSDPASVFVQNLAVQRRDDARYLGLRGKVFSEVTAQGEVRRELASDADLVALLRDVFWLNVPEAARLWPAICARHEALFGAQAAPTT
ncbi:arylamine N-acetyltransferase [Novosphingobium sp. ERN07]|uniref:arylamine N-acetyltransferase family protein n=1 Tax=Novosphingobium sp. ERN07 TaxID=2726187 RepID=UPI0014576FF9|nr:arylamine N-acetyltransferase [Novosphingobium sp. ERN07]NLR71096.1 arylamine N-acetyltransferase [Novosphingobium sp. ERN07]